MHKILFTSILILLLGTGLVIARNISVFVASSNSMQPQINKGDLLFVSRKPAYLPGDTITFRTGSQGSDLLTHRIVSRHEKYGSFYFETKGDYNQSADDGLVSESKIVGKVDAIIPMVGAPLLIAVEWHRIIIIWLAAALIVAVECKNIYQVIREGHVL